MSRKPGAPAAYLKEMYRKALTTLRMTGSGGEKHPEVQSERVWEDIVKKLFQKDYAIDAGVYGSFNEFVKKLAYFFHASIQGCGAYPGAAEALRAVSEFGKLQGLLADGQSFTPAQLLRALRQQDAGFELDAHMPSDLRILSAEKKARKPSDTIFRAAVEALAARGVRPADVLHVGSDLVRDLAPAKRLGMKTALFAGDKASLAADPEHLKDPQYRPDVMLTALPQIADVLS
jgi:FMN phosphatase YigB (HAD superfamily)